MKKHLFTKVILALFFSLVALNSYGDIRHKYSVLTEAYLYAEPNLKSERLAYIKDGKTFIVTPPEEGVMWVKVDYKKQTGYLYLKDLWLDRVLKSGEDSKDFFKKTEAIAANFESASDDDNEWFRKAMILSVVALVLAAGAFFLTKIDDEIGAILSLITLTASSSIVCYMVFGMGHLSLYAWEEVSTLISMASILAISAFTILATCRTFKSISNVFNLKIDWEIGILIPAITGFLLMLDIDLYWDKSNLILIAAGILQLLFCIHIARKFTIRGMSLFVIIPWLIISIAWLPLIIHAAKIAGLIVVVIMAAFILFSSLALIGMGGTFITETGKILKRILGGGFVDKEGNPYEDLGNGRARKKQ